MEKLVWEHEKSRLLGPVRRDNVFPMIDAIQYSKLEPVNPNNQYPHLYVEKTFSDGFAEGLMKAFLPINDSSFQKGINSIRKILNSMKTERKPKTMTTNETISTKTEELRSLQMKADAIQAELNELQGLKEHECEVTMRPVCECGHVFTSLEIDARLVESGNSSKSDIRIPRFNPVSCPNCHKRIMSVSNPVVKSGMFGELSEKITYAKE